MSTVDDKPKEVSDDTVDATEKASLSDNNEHSEIPKGPEDKGLVFPFFILGFIASLIAGWIIFPSLLYSKKEQPIDFNHVVHMELVDNGCESCHFFREDGTYSGVPKLEQCIDCHDEVQGDTDHEKRFVEDYVSKGIEVPWHIYSRQPDCVFFSHAAHVKKAKMDCETCHGSIGSSESLKTYEENRITGYSRDIWGKSIANMLCLKKHTYERMKMDDCAECHKEANGKGTSVQTEKDGCFVCHK